MSGGKDAIRAAMAQQDRTKLRVLPDPVFLGNGAGLLAVPGQEQNRIAYYYEEAPNGIRSVGTAPLWSQGGIPYTAQLSTTQPIQVFLGYPAHEDRVYIISQTPVGLQATGGSTVTEQQINQSNFPSVQNLQEFRVSVSVIQGLNEVYVNQATYTVPSTGARAEWAGATTTVIQTAITALSGSGKEQIGWITFDDETGTVHLETNTASTPPGPIPNRSDFSDATILAIATTYKKNIPIYLYDGQTLTEADIYRRLDSRMAWYPGTAGGGGGDGGLAFLTPAVAPEANGVYDSTGRQKVNADLSTISGVLSIAHGGTGGTTQATAQIGLGVREVLAAVRTYYVRTDGSDSNNGLSNTAGGAFLTIQKAVNVVAALDRSIYNVTIQVADGTYTGATSITGWGPGSGIVTLVGNTTTPSNALLNVTGTAITVTSAALTLGGFKIVATSIALTIQSGAQVSITGLMEYGACNFHFYVQTNATLSITANYTISGGAINHWTLASAHATLLARSLTITLTGTPAFSGRFAYINFFGMCTVDANTFTGSATGQRYLTSANGIIYTNGAGATYLPGSVAGATATQGQYI